MREADYIPRRWREADRRKRRRSGARVEAWAASGLSLRAFALREGFNVGSLSAWQRRFRVESAPTTTFAPLVVESRAAPGKQAFELTLRDGLGLKIPADFDEAMLTRIVRALGAAR